MCAGCWEEFGSPQIQNTAVFNAKKLVGEVYKYCSVGGNCHVQLDDWNLEDEFWDQFENWLGAMGNIVSPEQVNAEQACFAAMQKMSLEERASALALYDGYWEEDYGKNMEKN